MATRVADRVVLDTNVLLAASETSRPEYQRARAALDEWPARGTTLYSSGQILREYLSVATRAPDRNGLGLSQADSLANVHALRGRLRTMPEDEKVAARLLDILSDLDCAGKQVHDANIVATMLTYGVDSIVTMNLRDFARFETLVTVIAL